MRTARQHEVLALVAKGLLNKQIAYALGVTEGTVKSHVSALQDQLGTATRVGMTLAYLSGLPPIERQDFLDQNAPKLSALAA